MVKKKGEKLCCIVNPVHHCSHCGWILCEECGQDEPYFQALYEKGELKTPSRDAFDDRPDSIAARLHVWSWVK